MDLISIHIGVQFVAPTEEANVERMVKQCLLQGTLNDLTIFLPHYFDAKFSF